MTLTTPGAAPAVPPLAIGNIPISSRPYSDINSFTYRTGMSQMAELERIRHWIQTELVPFLNDEFGEITDLWDQNTAAIVTALNAKGPDNTLIVNAIPGFKGDGSADMTALINTALASVPVGSYTNAIILPTAFGKTVVRIDGTLVIDVARCGLTAPYGGVQFDASHNPGIVSMQVRASAVVANNTGFDGPKIGPFKLIGPGGTVAGSVGMLYSEPASGNTGGLVRDIRTADVSIQGFESDLVFGDNVFCLFFDNVVIKGFTKYGVSLPSTVVNSGERIVFTNSVIQEGYGSNSVGIQNDGGSIYFLHGSIDYVQGYFAQVTGSARTEFMLTHFERLITQGTSPWFVITGGAMKFTGGLITAAGTYDPATAPVNLFQNQASPTFTDGVFLLDGVTFGNRLQVSSGTLFSGTGNFIVRNTNRQNQYQTAFQQTGRVANLFSDQNAAALMDKWFLAYDTGSINPAARTVSGIVGNNGSVTPENAYIRNNSWAISLKKTGGTGSAFGPSVATPIERLQSVSGRVYLARTNATTGSITLKWMFATIVDDGDHGPRIARSQTFSSVNITPATDFVNANAWYQYDTPNYISRAPGWATHVVCQFECYNYGANGEILVADPLATQF